MRSKHKINYADSDKFKAELTKYCGLVLATPFCWDLLHFLANEEAMNLLKLLFEFILLGISIALIIQSYVIMIQRDEKYITTNHV